MWSDAVNDSSFQYDQLLPYFKKSTHFTPPNYAKRGGPEIPYDPDAYSLDGGPLQVSYTYYEPFSDAIKSALSKLGLQEIPGLNSGSLLGFAEFALSLDPTSATRSSSETSFLQAAIASSTIRVYQSALAKRILFNDSKVASGVEISIGGATSILSARKEVIVSSGTVCAKFPELDYVAYGPITVSIASITHGVWHRAAASTGGSGYSRNIRTTRRRTKPTSKYPLELLFNTLLPS